MNDIFGYIILIVPSLFYFVCQVCQMIIPVSVEWSFTFKKSCPTSVNHT